MQYIVIIHLFLSLRTHWLLLKLLSSLHLIESLIQLLIFLFNIASLIWEFFLWRIFLNFLLGFSFGHRWLGSYDIFLRRALSHLGWLWMGRLDWVEFVKAFGIWHRFGLETFIYVLFIFIIQLTVIVVIVREIKILFLSLRCHSSVSWLARSLLRFLKFRLSCFLFTEGISSLHAFEDSFNIGF